MCELMLLLTMIAVVVIASVGYLGDQAADTFLKAAAASSRDDGDNSVAGSVGDDNPAMTPDFGDDNPAKTPDYVAGADDGFGAGSVGEGPGNNDGPGAGGGLTAAEGLSGW